MLAQTWPGEVANMFIEPSASDQPGAKGICMTCRHIAYCSLRKQSLFTLWTCNHYQEEKPKLFGQPETIVGGEEKVPGLCMNCDHVRFCRLRQEGKVIFHCEEYL